MIYIKLKCNNCNWFSDWLLNADNANEKITSKDDTRKGNCYFLCPLCDNKCDEKIFKSFEVNDAC